MCIINAYSQPCANVGQNPSTAFPVCGTAVFQQNTVPLCSGQRVPSPTCTDNIYDDVNPYYYKFTCFVAGTLHFKIDPNTNTDDYDWSLYDITNQSPNAIYTNASLTIASNWSGTGGNTGMDNTGNNQYVCGGLGRPRWSRPANLIVGHQYLLMISHFTNSQSGYALSFGGGTAVITDTTPPKLLTAKPDCDGRRITLTLNKKMLCSSIAANGSDFAITPASATITNAISASCSTGFDADNVVLTLSNNLLAGNYVIRVKNGSDNNTILDYCSNQIPLTDTATFAYAPAQPTPIDSIAKPTCAPTQVTVLFTNKQIKCSSIAANGSDFGITGTYPINIISATTGTCTGGLTSAITLQLSQPLNTKGTFTIALRIGSDGNSIVDECDVTSLVGSSKSFSVKDTVNAAFASTTYLGCVYDTILAIHPVANEVNNWAWSSNDTALNVNTPNAQFIYQTFGVKNIRLVASNGFCTDTATTVIDLDNYIEARYTAFEDNCPNEKVIFTNNSIGKQLSYYWQYGNGSSSTDTNGVHTYNPSQVDMTYNAKLTITNNLGCTSSITKPINVLKLCGEYVPTAFTPNGDGSNDTYGPLYAVKANNLIFRVYNRWGQKVYETNNWRLAWNGKVNGVDAPTGVYVWSMQYTNRDTQEQRNVKGTVVLIR